MHVESTSAQRARRLELSPATFRKLALALGGLALADRRHGRNRPPHRLGPRLRALARVHRGEPVSEQELSLVHRVRQPDRQRADDPRDARRLGRRALHARRAALGAQARARARSSARSRRRRSARSRSTRTSTRWLVMSHFLLALVVLAAGVVVAVEAVSFERGRSATRLPQLDPPRRASSRAAALLALVVTGTISTAAGPHPGSADVERLWRLHAAVYVHVRATAIFGAALPRVPRLRHAQPRALAALRRKRRRRARACCSLQMGVGELQYRTHLPWWLVLVHVGLAAAVWACAVALVAVIERPPKAFAPSRTYTAAMADELRIAERPSLRRPILICAFRGWNDGGQGASLAAASSRSRGTRSVLRRSTPRSSSTSR